MSIGIAWFVCPAWPVDILSMGTLVVVGDHVDNHDDVHNYDDCDNDNEKMGHVVRLTRVWDEE